MPLRQQQPFFFAGDQALLSSLGKKNFFVRHFMVKISFFRQTTKTCKVIMVPSPKQTTPCQA